MNRELQEKLDILVKEYKDRYSVSEVPECNYDRLKEAIRDRKYKGQTIFKIDIYTIDRKKFLREEIECKSIVEKERYPFTRLWLKHTIYTIDDKSIEQLIDKEIRKKDAWDEIQYIFVTQIPCDKYATIKSRYSGYPAVNYITMRSYNYEGMLVDTTVSSSPGFGKLSKYYGRALDQIRFKKGDIVEIADLYTEPCSQGIKLGRIIGTPPNIVDACCKFSYWDNYLDDVYKVAILDPKTLKLVSHSVPSINLFYPRFPISQELMEILKNAKAKELWEK